MAFRLADYVTRNVPVQFFEEFVTGSVNTESGVIQFDDEDELFERSSTLVPVDCMVIMPIAKRSERVKEAAVFFEPEIDEDNDDLLVPSGTLDYMLAKGKTGKLVDKDGVLKLAISVPREYAARTIEALTRKEQSKIVAMNFNVLDELKKHDPALVERLMNQVKKGELTTDRIDAALNLDIALNNPQFMDVITDAQMQQSNAQLSLLLGCDVELLNLVYECVPLAEPMLDALKAELGLGGVKADESDDNSNASLEVDVSPTVIEEINNAEGDEPITLDVTVNGAAETEEPKGQPLAEVLGEFLTEPDEVTIDEAIAAQAIEAAEETTEETPDEPVEEVTEEPTEEPADETEEVTDYVDPFLDDTLDDDEPDDEEPTEEPTEEPAEEPTEEPAEEPAEAIADDTDNGSDEEPDEPAEEPDEEPAEETEPAEAKSNRRTATTKRRPRATRKPTGAAKTTHVALE